LSEDDHIEVRDGGWKVTRNPAAATRALPFMNCCGMLFVPVPRFKTLMSITPVRVCDYASYCEKKHIVHPQVDFHQSPEHPVVNVTWHEARAFCEWLTAREHEKNLLTPSLRYRLPTDLEWSAAIGLFPEEQSSPHLRSGRMPGYPWGKNFPPPVNAGNYSPSLGVDDFHETAPVGSFAPNRFGFYDLGGNVWEFVNEPYEPGSQVKVARGASCFNEGEDYLRASYRDPIEAGRRRNNGGFRLALSATV
jgi:formylglycine-generating enzyme required for sulfatase activity